MVRSRPRRSRSDRLARTSFSQGLRPSHIVLFVTLFVSVVLYILTALRTSSSGDTGGVGGYSTAAAVGSKQQQLRRAAVETIDCGGGQPTALGFDYPQLRHLRTLVKQWCAQQQEQQQQLLLSWQQLTAAYTAALSAAQAAAAATRPGSSSPGSSSSSSSSTDALLQELLGEATSLLREQQGSLLTCRHDGSLAAAWQAAHSPPNSSTSDSSSSSSGSISSSGGISSSSSSSSSRRYLLAANFHNSAAVLPNFLLQVLRLLLLLPQGGVAVSVYESGSSDTSRLWLTLLHQLLLPLGVPHNITLGGALSPRKGLERIQLLAQLRNAPLEPWLPPLSPQQQQQQQGSVRASRKAAPGKGSKQATVPAAAAPAAGAAELALCSGLAGSWVPDVIVYANDVFFCADDVMRLVLHDAHVACGMDFYDAPWMDAPPDNSSSSNSASGVLPGLEAEDEFFDPATGRVLPLGVNGSGAGSKAKEAGPLRFYDKWVARDAAGHRLVNRSPFITRHKPSQAALSAGQPVPMSCCWNGLAVLTAKPFRAGLRFRTSRHGECQGSECSLMCEDFARLGFRHGVMDPGVRLAYDLEQVDRLKGAAATAAAVDGGGGGDAAPVYDAAAAAAALPGLAPWLAWGNVTAASAALRQQAKPAAAAAQGTGQQQQQPLWMECCDLLPGHSYVDFRNSCHMVDVMARNHTAQVIAAPAGGP